MNPEHVKFFGGTIDGAAANFLNDAYSMIGIDDFFTYAKIHNILREPISIPEMGLSEQKKRARLTRREWLGYYLRPHQYCGIWKSRSGGTGRRTGLKILRPLRA